MASLHFASFGGAAANFISAPARLHFKVGVLTDYSTTRARPFGRALVVLIWKAEGLERRLLAACRGHAATAVAFPQKSKSFCHRRRGLRIVRGDDPFRDRRLSLAPSLLLPKPDPLALGSGFVWIQA